MDRGTWPVQRTSGIAALPELYGRILPGNPCGRPSTLALLLYRSVRFSGPEGFVPHTWTIASSSWDSTYRDCIHTCVRCGSLRQGGVPAEDAVDVLADGNGVLGLARSGCRPSLLWRELWRPVGSSRHDTLACLRRGAERRRRVVGLPQSCEALQSPMVGAFYILLPHYRFPRISRRVHRWRARRRVLRPLR